MNNDKLIIGGHEFSSRFILGSGKYSMKLIEAAVKDAGAEIITLAVRRANTKEQESILDYITENGYKSTTDKENINNLLFELSLVNIKSFDSLQDTPRVDEYSEINFELSTGTSSNKVFVYKTQEGFFVEQPYNGIFTIDEIQYQSIVAIFDD